MRNLRSRESSNLPCTVLDAHRSPTLQSYFALPARCRRLPDLVQSRMKLLASCSEDWLQLLLRRVETCHSPPARKPNRGHAGAKSRVREPQQTAVSLVPQNSRSQTSRFASVLPDCPPAP